MIDYLLNGMKTGAIKVLSIGYDDLDRLVEKKTGQEGGIPEPIDKGVKDYIIPAAVGFIFSFLVKKVIGK